MASNKHLNTFFPSPFSKYATETNEKKTENILTFDDDDDDEEEWIFNSVMNEWPI